MPVQPLRRPHRASPAVRTERPMRAAPKASDRPVPDASPEVAAAKWASSTLHRRGLQHAQKSTGRALPLDAVETCCTFQGATLAVSVDPGRFARSRVPPESKDRSGRD